MHQTLQFRVATMADVDALIAMLANDSLGAQREHYTQPLPASYYRAFKAIDQDQNNELIVACTGTEIIGMLQLTYIPYLTYQGGWRGLIEGVRIRQDYQSQGLGKEMFAWAIQRARDKGCHLVQLTTDKTRVRAKAFYETLGFVASHEGMKLPLDPP